MIITHIFKKDFDLKASKIIAKDLKKASRQKPLTIALPTGNTPTGLYQQLVKMPINWQYITIFMLDSYYPETKNSFYLYIQIHLLQYINLPAQNFNILNSAAKNPQKECQQYEEKIKKAGGLDITILGIGQNGHIAFNEPGSSKNSLTRLVKLSPSTIKLNPERPHQGLTVGINTILSSKKIYLLAKGDNKTQAVHQALTTPSSSDCPASFLQTHPQTTFILDATAGRLLEQKT